MINLTKLPSDEAERIAYAEGFTMAADLFNRIAKLEEERNRLIARLEDVSFENEQHCCNGGA